MTKDFKVVYFHGYGSSANSDKVKALSKEFDVYSTDIPVEFDKAFVHLDLFLSTLVDTPIVFVGTSLGGYWATVMSELYLVPSVIINPSCDPAKTLIDYKNELLTPKELSKYKPLAPSGVCPRIVLLAEDDEVLDFTIAEKRFASSSKIVKFKKAGHRFTDINIISNYIKEVMSYDFVSDDNI